MSKSFPPTYLDTFIYFTQLNQMYAVFYQQTSYIMQIILFIHYLVIAYYTLQSFKELRSLTPLYIPLEIS